jgi:hypothetical protein
MDMDEHDFFNMLGLEVSTPEQIKAFKEFDKFQHELAENKKNLTANEKIAIFKDRLKEMTGVDMPKNLCVCEAVEGWCILITTKETIPEEYDEYMQKVFKVIGRRGGADNGQLKNICSGNFVRTD